MTASIRFMHATVAFLALALVGGLALAQDGAVSDAPGDLPGPALDTASYAVFPVEGSDVSAQLQVSQMAEEQGSRLVLSLGASADPSATYRAAIYEGDCGPDRPIVLELALVGVDGDPYALTTETAVSFQTITTGDHFVYLFGSEEIDRPDTFGLDGELLACGEVGEGANR